MLDHASSERKLRALALGVNWFQSGSGGLDRVFFDLIEALPGAGIEANGLVLGPHDVSARTQGRVHAFGRHGATLVERLLRARARARELAGHSKFDVLAAHFALFALPVIDQLRDMPLVVHFHGPWADESAEEGSSGLAVKLKRELERRVYRKAARVIVLSRCFGDIARDRYGVPADQIRLVPGSVDLQRFDTVTTRQDAREQLGWPLDRPILLSVRRLARRMGLDRLITAMVEIVRHHPSAMLMLAGRGHMAEALRAQIEEAGLRDHVRLLGFVSDAALPLLYRAADFNLVPSVALEGFGLTTIEALASGTPSFVSPIGALPEVIGDLAPELIFASPSPQDIAERMIDALSGRIRVPTESECRGHVQMRYGAGHAASAVAAVYREVA